MEIQINWNPQLLELLYVIQYQTICADTPKVSTHNHSHVFRIIAASQKHSSAPCRQNATKWHHKHRIYLHRATKFWCNQVAKKEEIVNFPRFNQERCIQRYSLLHTLHKRQQHHDKYFIIKFWFIMQTFEQVLILYYFYLFNYCNAN